MQRRQFIKNLAGIFVAAAAPSIFIPSEPVNWKIPKKLKTAWSVELGPDLIAYHWVDPTHELSPMCVQDELQDLEYNPIILSVETVDGCYRDNWWKFPTPPIKMVEINYV